MLSDEEKKALEILKYREYDFDELYCTFRQSFIKPYDKSIGIILELIEKQSKEIEELKEKEKNKKLKWKPIKDYDRKKYDWVLVKYFDGDYECVPEVAEKRSDGKWYTSEKEIPFEVKYFFDMQQILEEE